MKQTTLEEITQNQAWIGLGIAGNQAGHLNQAGEADDFKNVDAAENAPKGIFPWFVPNHTSFLGENPLTHNLLSHNGESCLQPEPEVALIVEFHYSKDARNLLDNITVKGFTACNDCSRRLKAAKLSMKKNWGENSQGVAKKIYLLDDFEQADGSISSYRVACFLKRKDTLHLYGKDTPVVNYTYFHDTLVNWMTNQINSQKDEGPLERLSGMMDEEKPMYGIIAIGATAYEEFGNSDAKFLQPEDEVFVILYDSNAFDTETIHTQLKSNTLKETDGIILLQQQVSPVLSTVS